MADQHYAFDRNKPSGFRLGRLLEEGENFLNHSIAERATMVAMLGDSNQTLDASYQPFVDAYGFTSTAAAHAAWLEFDAAFNKFAVDGNVSNVLAGLRQFFAKLRS